MQLKAYAVSQDIPRPSSTYKGYAINWDSKEANVNLHGILFTLQITFLSAFIFLFALSSADILYENVFHHVYDSEHHHSRNPGYSLYWGIVLLSVLWNIGPSWIVISSSHKVFYSLAVLFPLLLLVAISVKKKTWFPIPGFKLIGCALHTKDKHSFVFTKCVTCVPRHILQVLSIWNLLVTFTFFVHYFSTVFLAFYLDPLGTLIKIVFIKTVAISLICISALLFAIDRFEYKCNWTATKKNVESVMATLTVLSLIPLLAYLTYVIGEIIFKDYSHINNWQSIFTFIPPLVFLLVSWFSYGKLFPKGVSNPTNPGKELVKDLVGDDFVEVNTNNSEHTHLLHCNQ